MDEMDEFLETYNLLILNQEKSENLNRHITPSEIEAVIKNLPANISLGPDGFTGEFYQIFREELTPLLVKPFHKIQHTFMIKTLSKVGIEETYLNIIKPYMTNPLPASYLMSKNYKCSP